MRSAGARTGNKHSMADSMAAYPFSVLRFQIPVRLRWTFSSHHLNIPEKVNRADDSYVVLEHILMQYFDPKISQGF